MKILIVDDEPLVAQYLIQCVRAADAGAEVVGAARSGAQALQMLEETAVELVFVDITMPKMDGLTLLQEIKRRYPATTVIMLTCHEEFEYARTAIQNKADDYVLKNEMDPEMLSRLLDRLRRMREARRRRQAESYSRQNQYLRRLVESDPTLLPVRESDLRHAQLGLEMHSFCVLVFRAVGENVPVLQQQIAGRHWNPLLYAYNDKERFLFANLREEASRLTELVDCLKGVVGCSRVHLHLEQLADAVQEALADRSRRFYGSEDRMLGYLESAEQLQPYTIRAAARMEEGDTAGACAEMEFMLKFAETAHPQVSLLKDALLQGFPHEEEAAWLRESGECSRTLQELSVCVQACTELLRGQDRRYSMPIRKAMEYIGRHYTEDLSLNLVADVVYLNRDYLSRQFKKEVGVNFTEYLMTVRLRHARRLLETTDMRVSDAAQRVGITNMSYFSTVFHKYFGCKPNDVRKNRGRGPSSV